MIDTTGWYVDITPRQAAMIRKRSKEFSEYDHDTKETKFRLVKDNLNIGSYHSSIIIKCFEDSLVYLEFSLPKQHRGNNVELLYPAQLELALGGVHASLVDRFGSFPPYMTWHLQRLDLCYGWRFPSQASAVQALGVLKTFDYPRKSKYLYNESVMWRGRTQSIKFYLKHNEYSKHNRKKLIGSGIDPLTDPIYRLSIGVLRFEITLRKQALDNLFNKKKVTYTDLLSQPFLERTLDEYLKRLTMNLDKSVMDDRETIRRLKETYISQKAIRLFTFYKLFTSPKLNHRQILKDHYNLSTIWRNKRDIAHAKVGLPNHTNPVPFVLSIPSELVVNKD